MIGNHEHSRDPPAEISESLPPRTLLAEAFAASLLLFSIAADAVDWNTDANGYTLNCSITDTRISFGQWKEFVAEFTLPADWAANVRFKCVAADGISILGDSQYDFNCTLDSKQTGSEFEIFHDVDEPYIKELLPDKNNRGYACQKVYDASRAAVKRVNR